MSLWDRIGQLVASDSQKCAYLRIQPAQTDRQEPRAPVEAGRHYFRLWLAEMFLQKRNQWFKTWHPAVHSLLRLDLGGQRTELPMIVDASKLGAQQSGRGDVLARNVLLTPTLPFNGGTLDLSVGLLAVEGDNALASLITTLSNVAGLLGSAQLAEGLKVAEPVAKGMQDLFGLANNKVHLGLQEAFAGGALESGYLAILRMPAKQLDPQRLWIVDGRLCEGASLVAAKQQPFERCDHLLLRVERFEERDDWDELSAIGAPMQDARMALFHQNEQQAQFFWRLAQLRAGQAPELTRADRRRVVEALRESFDQLRESMAMHGLTTRESATLQQIMGSAISVDLALQLGEPSLTEIVPKAHVAAIDGDSLVLEEIQPATDKKPEVRTAEQPRARHLQGRLPAQIRLGDRVPFEVRVALAIGMTPSVLLQPFEVPAQGAEIKLVLYADGFRTHSDPITTLHVPASQDSGWALFEIEALHEGEFVLEVSAYHQAAYLGTLMISVRVQPDIVTGAAQDHSEAISVRAPEEGEHTLELRYDAQQRIYRFQLRGPFGETDEILSAPLLRTPEEAVSDFVSALNAQAQAMTGYSADEARLWLKGKGCDLWNELIPQELQMLFWERQPTMKRLTILSAGDPIPWEVLYPTAADGTERGFLAEQFPIARWLFGPAPEKRLHISASCFVVPDGSLPSAKQEIDALKNALGGGDEINELTPLLDRFRDQDFDLLHFACHNTFEPNAPAGSGIKLGQSRFEPTFLSPFKGRLRQRSPLIFMNACRTDGMGASYTRLAGWANRFLATGAGAFIGSLWEVRDRTANRFAQAFYTALMERQSLGEAVKTARTTIQDEPGDPTWLAYTLYGDLSARL